VGRIRTIKPEILTDHKAAQLSDIAWRLWVSTWLMADDMGRFPAEPIIIAGNAFPGRSLTEIHGALTEASNAGFIFLYKVRGEQFGQISGWSKHQKINRPSGPKFPAPCKKFSEDSVNAHGDRNADHDRRFPESSKDSVSPHGDVSEPFPKPKAKRDRSEITKSDLAEAYERYPLKKGKAAGLAKAAKTIRNHDDFELFAKCIEHMREAFAADKTFCPHFSTFVSKRLWEDDDWPTPGGGGGGARKSSMVNPHSFLAGLDDS